MSWIVIQPGGREHYAIARGLNRRQSLDLFVTDFWRPRWVELLPEAALRWRPLGRLAGRFAEEIQSKTASFNVEAGLATARCYGLVRRPGRYAAHVDYGSWFGRRAARLVRRNRSATIFFGYDTGSLEALVVAKRKGLFAVVDQMDPAAEEWRLVEDERQRFPGWEERSTAEPLQYWQRRRTEWGLADLIVVNSEWSRQSLVKEGVPPDKVAVVPLAYEPTHQPPVRDRAKPRLKVLWLGSVILRKGIAYLIEAARSLPEIDFDIVGPIGISPSAVRKAGANVTFHGQVPRIRNSEFFKAADAFVLPTISDGFAITQLEAMSWGLPVIATPHCGQVVNDGDNGFIVPARDPQALVQAISRLDSDRELLARQSAKAAATLRHFTLDRVIDKLIDEVMKRR